MIKKLAEKYNKKLQWMTSRTFDAGLQNGQKMISGDVVGKKTLNFWLSKIVENLLAGKEFSSIENAKWGAEKTHIFKKFRSKIHILSTYNLHCQKIATSGNNNRAGAFSVTDLLWWRHFGVRRRRRCTLTAERGK